MVVMVIMGILVAIGTGSYVSATRRGRDNHRKDDLHSIATALESYFSDKGHYPSNNGSGQMVGCCANTGCGDTEVCNWGGKMQDTNGTIYMVLVPDEPISSQKYYYVGAGNTYKLYARLENTQDEGKGVKLDGYSATSCGGTGAGLCTYGISSLNTTP